MKRIILHWTAGTHAVSGLDRQHYHYIIDGDGHVHDGIYRPEDNESAQDGKYAAHTLNANTGSIGIAIAAMAGAVERPFNAGRFPITLPQIEALARLCARLCAEYRIPVSRETVLSHAEVQPTLRIAQRGKWDIIWLPGMDRPGDPVQVGDFLRAKISGYLAPAAKPPVKPATPKPDDSRTAPRAGIIAALAVALAAVAAYFAR